eukprot:124938-Chlamydomonas_euryale.AAC.1
MASVEDNLVHSHLEVYVHHFWGHYLFLPALPLPFGHAVGPSLAAWQLPVAQVDATRESMQRLCRLLWALQVDMTEGFEDSMKVWGHKGS